MSDLYIVIRYDSVFNQMHEVDAAESVIGRQEGSAIWLPHSCVSRNHALLVRWQTKLLIRDLKSRNGTLLQGRTITGDEDLADGASVEIDPYRLTVCCNIAGAIRAAASADESKRSYRGSAATSDDSELELSRLTAAQRRVFDLLVVGLLEKEVAASLEISIHTVHDHSKAVYKALIPAHPLPFAI